MMPCSFKTSYYEVMGQLFIVMSLDRLLVFTVVFFVLDLQDGKRLIILMSKRWIQIIPGSAEITLLRLYM